MGCFLPKKLEFLNFLLKYSYSLDKHKPPHVLPQLFRADLPI